MKSEGNDSPAPFVCHLSHQVSRSTVSSDSTCSDDRRHLLARHVSAATRLIVLTSVLVDDLPVIPTKNKTLLVRYDQLGRQHTNMEIRITHMSRFLLILFKRPLLEIVCSGIIISLCNFVNTFINYFILLSILLNLN